MMQFQGFDWLSGHDTEPLYHAQEIAAIKLSSGCPCKVKRARSSNIS